MYTLHTGCFQTIVRDELGFLSLVFSYQIYNWISHLNSLEHSGGGVSDDNVMMFFHVLFLLMEEAFHLNTLTYFKL